MFPAKISGLNGIQAHLFYNFTVTKAKINESF